MVAGLAAFEEIVPGQGFSWKRVRTRRAFPRTRAHGLRVRTRRMSHDERLYRDFLAMLFSSDWVRWWIVVTGITLLTASPLFANPCQIRFSTPRGANVQPQNTTRTADTLSARPQRPVARTAPVEQVQVMSNTAGRLILLDSLAWFSYPRNVNAPRVAKPAIRPTFVVTRAPENQVPDSTATSDALWLPGSPDEVRTTPESSPLPGTAVERGIRPRRGTSPSPP